MIELTAAQKALTGILFQQTLQIYCSDFLRIKVFLATRYTFQRYLIDLVTLEYTAVRDNPEKGQIQAINQFATDRGVVFLAHLCNQIGTFCQKVAFVKGIIR
ncbi:hypothetical protein D3C79_822350 [compost metagenome]